VQPRLFADVERTNGRPGLYSEDSFAFLDRAAGVVWERIREKLDEWYTSFPDADGDLRERFRSPRPDQHHAAWWELYVHNLLQSMGFEVTVHPTVPGTTGHPDFLAERGHSSFYVEAAAVFSGIVAPSRRGRLEAAVQDVINNIDASKFMVTLRYDRVGTKMPRGNALRAPIEAFLATLNPDELLVASPPASPWQTMSTGDWEISFRAIPRTPEYRGCPDNLLIGSPGAIAGFTNDVPKIRSAVTRKGKHYGTPDRPLVVAVLGTNGFVDDRVVEHALFGSEAVRMNIQTGETTTLRTPDGVWIGKRGPSAKRISAVLMGVGILPGACATAWPRLWHHFEPNYTLNAELPFSTARVLGEQLVFEEATSLAADVLGLPPEWPGPERSFELCKHRPGDHAPYDTDAEPKL
jgi:hypothetical protein